MQNKSLITLVVALGVILAIVAGFYFFGQGGPAAGSPENAAPESAATETEAAPGGGQNQNKLVTDDFEINIPAGWRSTPPAMGASAMAVNADEVISDPAAQKINFKSYLAVSYDILQGKSLSDYAQVAKDQLRQTIPSVVLANERGTTIDGNPAHALEMEMTIRGVNFKVLLVAIKGSGDDVWVLSFNTLQKSWDGYRETFGNVANSFKLKK